MPSNDKKKIQVIQDVVIRSGTEQPQPSISDIFTEFKSKEEESNKTSMWKWSTNKYSRKERSRKRRERSNNNQILLTNCYPIIEKVQEIVVIVEATINDNDKLLFLFFCVVR